MILPMEGDEASGWKPGKPTPFLRTGFSATIDGRIMVVSYSTDGDVFKADKPRQWSERRLMQRPRYRPFDIHPDGERLALFAASESAARSKQDRIVLVFNFFDEVRRVEPAK